MNLGSLQRLALIAVLCVAPTSSLRAQADPPPATAPAQTPAQRAWSAAEQTMQRGPRTIELLGQASLALPEGYGYIAPQQASALMEAMGNSVGESFLGLVVPLDKESDWMATLDYEPAGYIKDDDARHWKADELLDQLKQGTEADNERRAKLGIPALEVTHWIEQPAYDTATQRLVWSIELRDKDAAAGADPTVNYNTYLLGREGYVSLDLVTSESHIEAEKPIAKSLLAAVAFKDGKRYADFNSSTDKIAEYGLAALIGGIAVKKLGLLAMAGVLFAKFFKIIAIAVVAGGAALRKLFSARKA
jgi:uncharacterized membrane-anchored protein